MCQILCLVLLTLVVDFARMACMIETTYNKIAKNLKGSTVMPLAWLTFGVLLIVTGKMWWEDYMTSWNGYLAIPTNKATDVAWAVALLPQLIQMATAYVTVGLAKIKPEDRKWFGFDIVPVSMLVWLLAFLVDGYWDYTFKASSFVTAGQWFYAPAIIESFGIYGLGSELLGTISLAIFASLTKEGGAKETADLLIHVAGIVEEAIRLIITTIGKIIGILVSPLKAKEDKKQSNQKPRQQQVKRQPQQPKSNNNRGQNHQPNNRQRPTPPPVVHNMPNFDLENRQRK